MPAPTPTQLITGTGVQWTRPTTDLTFYRDTAALLPTTIPAGQRIMSQVPKIGTGGFAGTITAADLDPIPPEIHAIILLFSQGLAASFFNNAAIASPPTAFLDFNFAATLLYEYLGVFLRRGLPRGPRTDIAAQGPGA